MRSDALQLLDRAGAHLVLARDEKTPVWAAWQKRRPALDVVLAHESLLGLVPWSIRVTGVDLDSGSLHRLPVAWASYPTQRDGGWHFYYPDTRRRGNRRWAAHGCAGDLLGGNGYLILWGHVPERLADALTSRPLQLALPFPPDVFAPPTDTPTANAVPTPVAAVPERPVGVSLDLEHVPVGARNVSLFAAVRHWASRQDMRQPAVADPLTAWCRRVADFAHANNARFAEPLTRGEVGQLAYSVATWCWSKPALDHSPERQRQRGRRSGVARRARTAARDAAIVAAHAAGESQRVIAARFGLTPRAVRWILTRATDTGPPDRFITPIGAGAMIGYRRSGLAVPGGEHAEVRGPGDLVLDSFCGCATACVAAVSRRPLSHPTVPRLLHPTAT